LVTRAESSPMRGVSHELPRQRDEIEAVAGFKCQFSNAVLFRMMLAAEADAPGIRRLQSHSAIRTASDVSTFNR